MASLISPPASIVCLAINVQSLAGLIVLGHAGHFFSNLHIYLECFLHGILIQPHRQVDVDTSTIVSILCAKQQRKCNIEQVPAIVFLAQEADEQTLIRVLGQQK